VNPEIFGGKPIIRGLRISVELILSLPAQGETPETIIADYSDLEPDDLRAIPNGLSLLRAEPRLTKAAGNKFQRPFSFEVEVCARGF
jgi:hypothetical protein